MRNAKDKKYSLVLEGSWSGELGRAGLAGDLKVITAGMSQVRPHFDE